MFERFCIRVLAAAIVVLAHLGAEASAQGVAVPGGGSGRGGSSPPGSIAGRDSGTGGETGGNGGGSGKDGATDSNPGGQSGNGTGAGDSADGGTAAASSPAQRSNLPGLDAAGVEQLQQQVQQSLELVHDEELTSLLEDLLELDEWEDEFEFPEELPADGRFELPEGELPEDWEELPEDWNDLPEDFPLDLGDLLDEPTEFPEDTPGAGELPEDWLPENWTELPELPEDWPDLPDVAGRQPSHAELPELPEDLPDAPEDMPELPGSVDLPGGLDEALLDLIEAALPGK